MLKNFKTIGDIAGTCMGAYFIYTIIKEIGRQEAIKEMSNQDEDDSEEPIKATPQNIKTERVGDVLKIKFTIKS